VSGRKKLTSVQRRVLKWVDSNCQPPMHPVRYRIFLRLTRRGYVKYESGRYGWRGVGLTDKGYASLYR